MSLRSLRQRLFLPEFLQRVFAQEARLRQEAALQSLDLEAFAAEASCRAFEPPQELTRAVLLTHGRQVKRQEAASAALLRREAVALDSAVAESLVTAYCRAHPLRAKLGGL